jgi:hypothetical protein
MHSSLRRICSIGAMLCLVLGFASGARAVTSTFNGKSWQTGDIIVCFATGTCNVIRIVGSTPVLLDQISSGLLGATGDVRINNTLHVLVTDNGSSGSGHTSNLVMYSIASVNPLTGVNISHTPQVFDGSNGGAASNAQAVAVSSAGHMFVASAGSGNPPPATIVELGAPGGFVGSHAVPGTCIDNQLASIDLSAGGSTVYLTSQGGTIQNFSLSSNTCTPFAKLGLGVTFNGVRDISAGSLAGNCKAVACPSDETVLVVAKGFFDSNGNGVANASDANICTDVVDGNLVSCALLLDTGGPGLIAPPWQAGHQYTLNQTILDASLHVQKVTAVSGSGKSGSTAPVWNDTGTGTTVDNKVTWTHQGTSVVARYPVTGKSTLKALTLDPFVTDCTGNGGTACFSGYTPAPKISNFWLGDNGSSNFYKLDFTTGGNGTPAALDANFGPTVCPTCSTVSSIQGIGIYGAEGANQPGLAKLLLPTQIGTNPATSTQTVQFLGNTETVSLYNLATPVNLALYASLVDRTSCFNDQNSALQCRAIPSDSNKAIVWKIDVPQGSVDSLGTASIAAKYASSAFDNSTDGFTDMLYDTTVLVGTGDPATFTKPSVQSQHEVLFSAAGSLCSFLSPSANTCYRTNRGTLPFSVPQCSGLSVSAFQGLGLQAPSGGLSLVQTFPNGSQAPLPVDLSGSNGGATNGKASFRYDASSNQWVYQFSMDSLGGRTGTFTACAFDSSGTVQTFCVKNVKFQTSCP